MTLLTACRGLRPLAPDEPFGACGLLTAQNVPQAGTPVRCARQKARCHFPENKQGKEQA